MHQDSPKFIKIHQNSSGQLPRDVTLLWFAAGLLMFTCFKVRIMMEREKQHCHWISEAKGYRPRNGLSGKTPGNLPSGFDVSPGSQNSFLTVVERGFAYFVWTVRVDLFQIWPPSLECHLIRPLGNFRTTADQTLVLQDGLRWGRRVMVESHLGCCPLAFNSAETGPMGWKYGALMWPLTVSFVKSGASRSWEGSSKDSQVARLQHQELLSWSRMTPSWTNSCPLLRRLISKNELQFLIIYTYVIPKSAQCTLAAPTLAQNISERFEFGCWSASAKQWQEEK